MFELISLEDSFLRRAFLLEGVDFKVLSFCHSTSRGRGGQKFSLAFTDVSEALDLTALEIREVLQRLARGEWLVISDLDDERFVYEVRGLPEAPVMALQHLAFDGTVSPPETAVPVAQPVPLAAPAPNPVAQGLLNRMIEKIADPRVREQESAALQALLRSIPADTIVGALRGLGPETPHRFTELLSRFSEPGALTL